MHVTTVPELIAAVNNVTPDTTILLADGVYELRGSYLWFDVPDVTLRGASGNREGVIIDGNYETAEIVTIATSGVTIADLTLIRAYTHPVHVVSTSDGHANSTLIHNVHIIDPGEQAIKINPDAERTYFADNGEIACSHIELTDAGRLHIRNNCYTGGVDGHQAWGWTIRDNVIEGFWCENGLSEHGAHFWTGSRDTLVERNVLIDNARGVGFGLLENGSGRVYGDDPCPSASGYVDHFDGIVRSNFVFASRPELFSSQFGFDCGICLWQACGSRSLHNTVISTDAPFSSIEWRFSNTDAEIANNLVSHNLRDRGGTAIVTGNLENVPLSLFVDGGTGDLHLTESANLAIDHGVDLASGLCDDDIDGDRRPIGPAPDVGADEVGVPLEEAVTDLRVAHATSAGGVVTATLEWSAPAHAVTVTLRYAESLITEGNWVAASPIIDALPASAETFVTTVSYDGDTLYFALKSRPASGDWSILSNNAFWPIWDAFLPLAISVR